MARYFYKRLTWILLPLLFWLVTGMRMAEKHPYYLSVTEIEHNATEQELQIACKIFSDDLEETLKATYRQKVEVIQPADKKKTEALLADYLQKHLRIEVDGVAVKTEFIGYSNEQEATWSFLVVKNVGAVKKASVFCDLLYDTRPEQINIFHFRANGERKSYRLTMPSNTFSLSW